MKEMCVYKVGYEMKNEFERVYVINLRMKIFFGIRNMYVCLWICMMKYSVN